MRPADTLDEVVAVEEHAPVDVEVADGDGRSGDTTLGAGEAGHRETGGEPAFAGGFVLRADRPGVLRHLLQVADAHRLASCRGRSDQPLADLDLGAHRVGVEPVAGDRVQAPALLVEEQEMAVPMAEQLVERLERGVEQRFEAAAAGDAPGQLGEGGPPIATRTWGEGVPRVASTSCHTGNMTSDGVDLDDRQQRQLEAGRVAAFTDGVFAIIITILVLDIRVPDLGSGQSLRASIDEVQPTFVSFVISFLLVGMYWVWHRGAFAEVRYVDLGALWLNLLFLLPVSLIPYGASALGEYPDDPTAMHLYGLVLVWATLMRTLITWYHHRHPGLLFHAPTLRERRLANRLAAAPAAVYVVAIAAADAAPAVSKLLYFLVPALYFTLVTLLRTDPHTREAAKDLS